MKVSVVIPAYKHSAYILNAISSVFLQDLIERPEVIVVNDGSPDDTAQVLEPLIKDGSILYIHQENAGQAAARSRGAAASSGEFLAFLDDDDVWPAGKLAWQVHLLEATPDAVMAWGEVEDLNGKPLYPMRANGCLWQGRRVIDQCLIRSPGQTLIRREAYERVGGFDPDLWGVDDFDLYIRLAEKGRFVYSPRTALRYRWHAQNASQQSSRMREGEQKVRRKFASMMRCRLNELRYNEDGYGIDESRQLDCLWLAWYEFLEGNFPEARRHYLAAAAAAPKRFLCSGAWRQARAAFVPDSLRPIWRHFRESATRQAVSRNV